MIAQDQDVAVTEISQEASPLVGVSARALVVVISNVANYLQGMLVEQQQPVLFSSNPEISAYAPICRQPAVATVSDAFGTKFVRDTCWRGDWLVAISIVSPASMLAEMKWLWKSDNGGFLGLLAFQHPGHRGRASAMMSSFCCNSQ